MRNILLAIVLSVVALFVLAAYYGRSYGSPATTPYASSATDEAAASDATSCSAGDFKVKGLRGTDEYGYANVVGTLINSCSEAAGVELKVTLYDKSGDVVNTEDEWPASVSNIPPRVPYPFKLMLSSGSGWSKYSVVPIDAKQW